jgi:hypothetical protein
MLGGCEQLVSVVLSGRAALDPAEDDGTNEARACARAIRDIAVGMGGMTGVEARDPKDSPLMRDFIDILDYADEVWLASRSASVAWVRLASVIVAFGLQVLSLVLGVVQSGMSSGGRVVGFVFLRVVIALS